MENMMEKAKPQGKKYKFKVRNEVFETENFTYISRDQSEG